MNKYVCVCLLLEQYTSITVLINWYLPLLANFFKKRRRQKRNEKRRPTTSTKIPSVCMYTLTRSLSLLHIHTRTHAHTQSFLPSLTHTLTHTHPVIPFCHLHTSSSWFALSITHTHTHTGLMLNLVYFPDQNCTDPRSSGLTGRENRRENGGKTASSATSLWTESNPPNT